MNGYEIGMKRKVRAGMRANMSKLDEHEQNVAQNLEAVKRELCRLLIELEENELFPWNVKTVEDKIWGIKHLCDDILIRF